MTVQEFLFDLPLYQEVSEDEGSLQIVEFLTKDGYKNNEVDGYNCVNGCESTFALYSGINTTVVRSSDPFGRSFHTQYTPEKDKEFEAIEVILRCKRYGTYIYFMVHIEERDYKIYISKVGQYPSVADFHIGQVHKYDKVLPRDEMREFTKAIGLAANGVGIGSFVYLRRIFEHLVFEAKYAAMATNPEFDETAFTSARMNERIQMLSDYLPDFLVENHNIYSILSKGVHELSEEECKKYFTVLKESIEIILDEKIEAYRKAKHKKTIGNAIAEITGAIK